MFRIRSRLIAPFVVIALAQAGCATGPARAPAPSAEEQARIDAARRSQVHYDLGAAYLQEGKPGAAIRELLQAARLTPSEASVHLALAQAYWYRGRMPEAEEHLLRTLEIAPSMHSARNNLAAFYIQTERYEQAIAQLQMLIDDATFDAPWTAHTNLGWAAYKLGRFEDARRELTRALDYRSHYWRARLNLGIVEAAAGNPKLAIELLEEVLADQPGPHAESEVHYRLAEIHEALGERQRAIVHLSQARDQRPDGTWGKRSEESLERLK